MPRGRELSRRGATLRVAGLLVWSRFPFWEIRRLDDGTELRLSDMRFKGLDRNGFTATTVVR